MRNREDFRKFAKMLGIDALYNVQVRRFTGTTVVAERGGHKVTVSEVLKTAGFVKDFIEVNFNTKDKKYAQTLLALKALNYFFNNLQCDMPTKEQMHFAVDVIHEIEDMRTNNPNKWHINTEIAITLNVIIDWFAPYNEG